MIIGLKNNERGEYEDPQAEISWKSFNLRDAKDLQMIGKAIMSKRYKINDCDKDSLIAAITKAIKIEQQLVQPNAKNLSLLGKLLIDMENANQVDEHLLEKYKRLDEGKMGDEEIVIKVIFDSQQAK